MLGIRRNDPLRKLEWKYMLVSEQVHRLPAQPRSAEYERLLSYRDELHNSLLQLKGSRNV